MPASNPRLRGLLFATGAPLCWSVGGVVMRSVDATGWDIVFWRSGTHAVVLGVALGLLFGTRTMRDMRRAGWSGWISALLLAGVFTFHVLAIANTTVANVLILQSTSPIFVAVLAALVLGEYLDRRSGILLAIALAGLAPVLAGSFSAPAGAASPLGDALALAVSFCSTINFLVIRRARAVNLIPATVAAGALAAAIAWPFAAPFALPAQDICLLIGLGVVQNVFGVSLFYAALRHLPAAEVGLLCLLEPALGPIWVWLFVGEEPGLLTMLGGAAIVGALLIKGALDLRYPVSAKTLPA
ncbi:MAG TPA: DMT family transporter [Alphaproteobacteria bacterium]|nr:DMT family transporter [Alphaproteobacteria bacterium]